MLIRVMEQSRSGREFREVLSIFELTWEGWFHEGDRTNGKASCLQGQKRGQCDQNAVREAGVTSHQAGDQEWDHAGPGRSWPGAWVVFWAWKETLSGCEACSPGLYVPQDCLILDRRYPSCCFNPAPPPSTVCSTQEMFRNYMLNKWMNKQMDEGHRDWI